MDDLPPEGSLRAATRVRVQSREEPTDETPQLNEVRRRYADGEISEGRFEQLLEQALENGPSIGESRRPTQSLSPLQRVLQLTTAPCHILFAGVMNKLLDDSTIGYDADSNRYSVYDSEPDIDDHPAEIAGTIHTMTAFLPLLSWFALGSAVVDFTAPASASGDFVLVSLLPLFLYLVATLAMIAPFPSVDVELAGLGRHTINTEADR